MDVPTLIPRSNRDNTGYLQMVLGRGQQSNILGTLRDPLWALEDLSTLKRPNTNDLHPIEPDYKVRSSTLQMEERITGSVGKDTRGRSGGQTPSHPSDGRRLQLLQQVDIWTCGSQQAV